jgi:(+)-pinoresinol hydroxylase
MRAGHAAVAAFAGLALAAGVCGQEQSSSWTTFSPRGRETASPLLKRGEEAYQARCNLCHGRVAQDVKPGMGGRMAGTEALAIKYQGRKPAVLEDRTDLTADEVEYYVRHGSGIMPFFRKTEVSEADLDAIAAYLSRRRR